MKKRLTTVLAALLLITMSFALMACGKPTLEDWYTKNEAQFTEAEDELNSMDMGCTVEIAVEDGNVLVYRYTFTEALDATNQEIIDALAEAYDSMFDEYKDMFAELRTQIMDETSAENVIIRMAVLNPDGTELYARDFTE